MLRAPRRMSDLPIRILFGLFVCAGLAAVPDGVSFAQQHDTASSLAAQNAELFSATQK
jgi:hypothetical protein